MRRFLLMLLMLISISPVWAARDFNGTTQNAEIATALFTNEPGTICAWFNLSTNAAVQVVASVGNNGATDGTFQLQSVNTDVSIRANKRNDVGNNSTATATATSTGLWMHACAVFTSNTSRSISLNGATFVTDVTSVTDPTPDVSSIGVFKHSGFVWYCDCQIGMVAFWTAALTQAEVTALAQGACPKRIRTDSLISFVPLYGVQSPEVDLMGARTWTLVNAPAQVASAPRVASCQ
jgi:hypothetical protein